MKQQAKAITLIRRPRLIGLILWTAVRDFFLHGGLHLAASIAFFAILSFIPFFFIVASIAGKVIGNNQEILSIIRTFLDKLIPYYSEVLSDEITKISLGLGLPTVLTVLFMIWIGSLVFDSLGYALNRVFESTTMKSYFKLKLLSISIYPISGMLLILSLFFSTIVSAMDRLPVSEYLPGIAWLQPVVINTLLSILPYLILISVLILLFVTIPPIKITFAQALTAAICCVIGWSLEKWIFGLLIVPNPNYGIVYGSLQALIVLILWIYFAMCTILMSAELLAAYKKITLEKA